MGETRTYMCTHPLHHFDGHRYDKGDLVELEPHVAATRSGHFAEVTPEQAEQIRAAHATRDGLVAKTRKGRT